MEKKKINWQVYVGVVLVLSGALLLADLISPVDLMRNFWPLLVILFGVSFFVGMVVSGKRGAGLAIPGSIITTVGVLFLVQNTFHLWVTWAYAWGLGLLIMNIYLKQERLRRAGGLVIGIGLTLFVIFGVLFEIILNIAGTDLHSGVFLGVGLILLGLFVVFSKSLFSRNRKTRTEQVAGTNEAEPMAPEGERERQPERDVSHPLPEGAEFSGLVFKSLGEVSLSQGEACSLTVEGDPDLMADLRTEVVDGVLEIRMTTDVTDWTKMGWGKGDPALRYHVTMPTVEKVVMGGAGDLQASGLRGDALDLVHSGLGKVTLDDLNLKTLSVNLKGVGEVRLSGVVESQSVVISGAGGYQAEDLQSQSAQVQLAGAGEARVWAEATLEATVTGAGSIRYKGNPVMTQQKTDLGEIKAL